MTMKKEPSLCKPEVDSTKEKFAAKAMPKNSAAF